MGSMINHEQYGKNLDLGLLLIYSVTVDYLENLRYDPLGDYRPSERNGQLTQR
jgi:hypothetical protein